MRRPKTMTSTPSHTKLPSNLIQQYHICDRVRVASRLYVDGKGLEQVWRDSFSEAVALRRMGHLKMADAELITNAALLTQAFQAMAAEAAVWFPAISSQSDALSTSSTTSMINDQSPENAICSRVKAAIARALRILRPPEQKKEGHGPVSARRWERNRDRVKIVTHCHHDLIIVFKCGNRFNLADFC